MDEGDGGDQDRHRDGGDLGVAGDQLPPHVRHDGVVLQPDKEAPVPPAGLEQREQREQCVEGNLSLVEGVGEGEAASSCTWLGRPERS